MLIILHRLTISGFSKT